MIRFTKTFAVAAAFLILPSMASAVGITIVSSSQPSGSVLSPGETITFNLAMTQDAVDLYGIGVTVDGYDTADTSGARQGNLAYTPGSSSVVADAFGIDIGSGPQFGLSNAAAPNGNENWSVNWLNPQAYTASLFQGVSTSAAPGDGSDDLGIGGTLVSAGDVHFQAVFTAIGSGTSSAAASLTLSFNVETIRAGGVSEISSQTFGLTVIPEPGTALLMGLGLAGLATIRRS